MDGRKPGSILSTTYEACCLDGPEKFSGVVMMRIPLILISHSGRSRSPIPVILITLFTMPEEGTADSMTWRWVATTDG